MASTDAKPVAIKNQALRVTFPLYDADGDLVTAAGSLDSEISKDGGTFTDCTNEATEIATSSGIYYLDLTATEMNADTVAIIVKSTGAKTLPMTFYPQSSGGIPVQVEGIDSGAITAASIASDAITAAKIAADAIGASELASDAVAEIADAVWDEVISTSAHTIANSAGKRLRTLTSSIVRSATAQGGGAGYITLDASASATDGAYDPGIVLIEGGTGAGQSRLILEYNGTSKRAYVDRDWKTTPDATSEFVIISTEGREHVNEGLAQGGSSTTITLNALASATDDSYNGQVCFIRSATGADQARRITGYDGTTKVATVDHAWDVAPDATSVYVMLPTSVFNSHEFQRISDMIEHQRGAHTVQGSTYYVDPVNGNDANPGTRSRPKATVQSAHDDLVTDSAHDLIVLLSGAAAGVTTLTEDVTLTKRYLQIRGPGRDFIWTRSGAGDTITVSGDGIGLSGFRLQTAALGTGAGVQVTSGSDFCGIRKLWIENTQGDGILVDDASNAVIEDCVIEEAGQSGAGDGIKLKVTAGTVIHTFIKRCHISNSPNNGIETVGAVSDTVIADCSVHGSGEYGIDLGTGHVNTMLINLHAGDNTSGDLSDADGSVVDSDAYLLAQLESAHGVGAWTSGGLSGTNSVTITVQEADTTPIVGCTVTVYAADNTGPALDQGVTDGSGQVSFNLNASSYALRLSRYGYSFTVPETITVETDPDTFTLTGTEIAIPATPDGWEDQPLRRQKVKYNSANTDTPLTYQRVLDGVKATPSAATITIYAPGNSTALVSGAAMTISGSVATYSPDTTTVASWPIGTGYRGEVSVTISGTTYTDKIVFDVVKYILHLNVGVDQLEAMDDRIASMEFAGSEDFERPLSAARDILCAVIETKVLKDKRLIENMILDQSQLSLPMRYLALTMIFESKNNHEQADRYRARFNETLRAALSTIQYDDDQDGEESSTIGTTNGIVIGT